MTADELKEIIKRGHVRVKGDSQTPKPEASERRVGVKGIIRQSSRKMNSTEARFEIDRLKPMKHTGEIVSYRYESIRLKLANGKWYKCDFQAINGNGKLIFFEIKGARPRQREAGIGDIKVAAFQYPEFEFWIFRYREGQWDDQRVLD